MKEPQEYLADPLARARRYLPEIPGADDGPKNRLTEI